MYHKVEQTFYTLSAAVLFGIMFIVTPSSSQEVTAFQNEIIGQTKIAFNQVLGDINLVEPLDLVWSGIDNFYLATSTETLAIIPAVEVPESVNLAFQKAGNASVEFIAKGLENVLDPIAPKEAADQVAGANPVDPIYNIVPPFTSSNEEAYNNRMLPLALTTVPMPQAQPAGETIFDNQAADTVIVDPNPPVMGRVAGEQVEVPLEQPVNDSSRPWVTIKDNLTGQMYCVAIYNSEVNKYLGECKRDYY